MIAVSEDEMILEWLKAEIGSPRFFDNVTDQLSRMGYGTDLIVAGDIYNKDENIIRRQIMDYRGYNHKSGLFQNFPENVDWFNTSVFKTDLMNHVRYINYSYWNELSSGTRKPTVAAKNIKNGLTIYSQSNDGFHEIEYNVRAGLSFPKLIIVCDDTIKIVLEGHARLTGYALAFDALPDQIDVIVGYTENLKNWSLY